MNIWNIDRECIRSIFGLIELAWKIENPILNFLKYLLKSWEFCDKFEIVLLWICIVITKFKSHNKITFHINFFIEGDGSFRVQSRLAVYFCMCTVCMALSSRLKVGPVHEMVCYNIFYVNNKRLFCYSGKYYMMGHSQLFKMHVEYKGNKTSDGFYSLAKYAEKIK